MSLKGIDASKEKQCFFWQRVLQEKLERVGEAGRERERFARWPWFWGRYMPCEGPDHLTEET